MNRYWPSSAIGIGIVTACCGWADFAIAHKFRLFFVVTPIWCLAKYSSDIESLVMGKRGRDED
jgi:hypothetical protein